MNTVEEYNNKFNQGQHNYMMEFGNLFTKGLYRQGIVNGVKPEDLHKYFSNPDMYQDVLSDIVQYFYISNAEIHQLFEMVEALPTLNYRIETFEQDKNTEKNIISLKKKLHNINHKSLTRDLLKQNTSTGNVVGLWIGKKPNFYPFIFSNLEYLKIRRGLDGHMRAGLDMSWFDSMYEDERELYLSQLGGIISKNDYENYLTNREKNQIFLLPLERTFVLRTGTLNRNQAIGGNWATPVLFDVLHKKKLKDVEQTIANKIINAVAVLKMGQTAKQGEKDRDFDTIPEKLIKSIHNSVKNALSNGAKEGISLVTIPNFSNLDFPDIKSDGLDGDKFKQTDSDIRAGLGISGVVLNGEGTNFASAKLNLEIVYKRIAVLLEETETEAYQKLIDLMLPNNQKGNYYMSYDKEMPLTLKEKIDYLSKLNDKGWSSKHLIDSVGMDFDIYLEQTMYETETLKLQEKLIPPKTAHTTSSDSEKNGRPTTDDNDIENENTQQSKEFDGNSTKK